jgi:hypothetical protein
MHRSVIALLPLFAAILLMSSPLAAASTGASAPGATASTASTGASARGLVCTPAGPDRCPARSAAGRSFRVRGHGEPRARRSAALPPPPVAGPSKYTGLGFDACAAPSTKTMTAWAASPYRAIGVYIGGLNRACSQPNLTAEWVAQQVAAGWHLIPTYVGLQAPTSSCASCAKLSTGGAAFQGAAAAEDAVADAAAIGMGPGSPLYFDMESYTQTSSSTNATLKFLEAWTTRLHALGYQSGVYSSSASGIEDLASRIGSLYPLPDNIWIANWNGRQSTEDSYVPDDAWSLQQRIHQYRGGHDERWGGVAINIDNNYLDGGTVGPSTAPPPMPPLTVSAVKPRAATVSVRVRCGWESQTSCPGQIILRSFVRTPGRGAAARVVRLTVARRTFRLGGGRSHSFRVALNSRGRPLLMQRRKLRTQLLVAIPGARATRGVQLVRPR